MTTGIEGQTERPQVHVAFYLYNPNKPIQKIPGRKQAVIKTWKNRASRA